MIKLYILLLTFFSSDIYACPGCAGSMDNPKDAYTVYILMAFLGLTYIPFSIIYRTIIKNRNLNNKLNEQ